MLLAQPDIVANFCYLLASCSYKLRARINFVLVYAAGAARYCSTCFSYFLTTIYLPPFQFCQCIYVNNPPDWIDLEPVD